MFSLTVYNKQQKVNNKYFNRVDIFFQLTHNVWTTLFKLSKRDVLWCMCLKHLSFELFYISLYGLSGEKNFTGSFIFLFPREILIILDWYLLFFYWWW